MQSFPQTFLRRYSLFGWALALILLHGHAAATVEATGAEAGAREQRLLVVGDSISAAYGMSLEQGWVSLLATTLSRDTSWEVVNASISGETSAGGLRRLPALLEEHQPSLVVIELGGNDGLRGYPTQKLRANLARMTRLSRAAGANVIIVPMEIPPNYGPRYTSAFRATFAQVASEEGAALAPFILQDIATQASLMQEDGIHPTVDAQPQLLENMLPTILAEMEKL